VKGLFISLEGPEGSGKTTQAGMLSEYLTKRGYGVTLTYEPGGTPMGRGLRDVLLNSDGDDITPWCELFLYLADRAHHVEKLIRPALHLGKVVICDRFIDATVAYQGYGRGIDLGLIKQLNLLVTQGILPDLTVILDIEAGLGLSKAIEMKCRLGLRDGDRLEQGGLDFHRRVREGYLAIAKENPLRVKLIPVDGPIEEIQARIREFVDKLL
jgi:dTMP kinase